MVTGTFKSADMEQPFMPLRMSQELLLGPVSEALAEGWEENKCMGMSNVV